MKVPICPSIHSSICLSVYLSVHSFVHPSIRPSICPSMKVSICPCIHSSICLSVHLSVHPFVCPSIRPCFPCWAPMYSVHAVCPLIVDFQFREILGWVEIWKLFEVALIRWVHLLYSSPGQFLQSWESVQFSHSVMSDFLQPHGLQHVRPPCPSPTPGVYSNSCPSSQWCHPTISSSVVPFSACLQSFPDQGLFQWVSFSHYGHTPFWMRRLFSVFLFH